MTLESILGRLNCRQEPQVCSNVALHPRQGELGDEVFAELTVGLAEGWNEYRLVDQRIKTIIWTIEGIADGRTQHLRQIYLQGLQNTNFFLLIEWYSTFTF